MGNKTIEYEFGVMSSRWLVLADNLNNAKMAFCLYFQQDIPVAIFKPIEEGFSPLEFLQSNPEVTTSGVKAAYKSIRKLK